MSEIVERGAKAMYERKFRAEGYKWEDSTAQDEWRDLMRTAILAMRVPTSEMLSAAGFNTIAIAVAWQAMIDEVLK